MERPEKRGPGRPRKENPKTDLKLLGLRVQPHTEMVVGKIADSLGGKASISSSAEQLLDASACWVEDGEKSALASISKEEKFAIIGVVNPWWIEPLSTLTPESLSRETEEYLSPGNEGFFLGLDEERKKTLVKKLAKLSYAEATALLLWAKRFWTSEAPSVDEYCK